MTTVKTTALCIVLAALIQLVPVNGQCNLALAEQTAVSSHAEDDKAIRAQAAEYARAMDTCDLKALGDMWTEDATYIDQQGREFRGRETILKEYSNFFKANGRQILEIRIESIKFPAADVAVEHGVTRLLHTATPGVASRYTAVHVKESGRWRMSSVTETGCEPVSSSEYLNELDWLIGEWTAVQNKQKVHFKARWVANKHFIFCTYRPDAMEADKVSDAQIIGWDPIKHHIFSSHFGADGGFGHAVWSRGEHGWLMEAWAVEPDGSRSSADYVMRPLDNDSFTWQSQARTINGNELPDTEQIKISRDTATSK